MISSGNKELDDFLGNGYKKELTFIYGPGASGKTTLCTLCTCDLLKKDKKVVYLDTENGFSIERFMQICGPGYLLMLNRLLVLKANNFEDQCRRIDSFINFVNIDLVIVDSLGFHYRGEVKNSPKEINKKMDRQLRILTEITRKGVPVIVSNQVSTNPDDGEIKMVGGEMVRKWGKGLIELKNDPRRVLLKNPEEKEIGFEIVDEGIKINNLDT